MDFEDARKLIPHLKPLIYSISPRLKMKTYFIRENRTYFEDEIKDIVDWLIESPYNNWQEEDREYLMNCDNEKLFKYERETISTIDLEDGLNGLYESNNRSKNMKIKESKTFEEKIDAFISRIEEYKKICENTYMPNYWKVSYSKVPEGLKLTIDTDSWFDESYQLGHLIDFILDVYGASYDDSTYELTGIDVHSDVEFLGGKKSDWATYLIKDDEKFKESKINKSRIIESFERILNHNINER